MDMCEWVNNIKKKKYGAHKYPNILYFMDRNTNISFYDTLAHICRPTSSTQSNNLISDVETTNQQIITALILDFCFENSFRFGLIELSK